jgi:hypothetical protein
MRSDPGHLRSPLFKLFLPLSFTLLHDWEQTDLSASLFKGKKKSEPKERALCFLSLAYRVLGSPYQILKHL